MLTPPVIQTTDSLALPPVIQGEGKDQELARLLLFALDNGYLTAKEIHGYLESGDGIDIVSLMQLFNERISADMRKSVKIPPGVEEWALLSVSATVFQEEFSDCDSSGLVFTGQSLFLQNPDLSALPRPVAVLLIQCLSLIQHFYPMMIGYDILDLDWWSRDLCDESEDFVRSFDIDALSVDEVIDLVETHSDRFDAIYESMQSEMLSVPDVIREFAYDRCSWSKDLLSWLNDLPPDAKFAEIRSTLDLISQQPLPSLSMHPLVEWAQFVADALDLHVRSGIRTAQALRIPESCDLDPVGLHELCLVGFGHPWVGSIVDNHFEMRAQVGEPFMEVLPFDELANDSIREILNVLTQCTVLLFALSDAIQQCDSGE